MQSLSPYSGRTWKAAAPLHCVLGTKINRETDKAIPVFQGDRASEKPLKWRATKSSEGTGRSVKKWAMGNSALKYRRDRTHGPNMSPRRPELGTEGEGGWPMGETEGRAKDGPKGQDTNTQGDANKPCCRVGSSGRGTLEA